MTTATATHATTQTDAYFVANRHMGVIRSRCAHRDGQVNFRRQATLITDAVIAGTISPELLPLADDLAARVERHGIETRRELVVYLEASLNDQALATMHDRLKVIESEAARTVLLILGVPVAKVAPVDYPTLVRAYLVARNAVGGLA
jgi:hypothetical protein